MRFDIYITREDKLYIASVPALPGCTVLGRSEKEVLTNIRDIIELNLQSIRQQRKEVPDIKVVKIHHVRYPTAQTA